MIKVVGISSKQTELSVSWVNNTDNSMYINLSDDNFATKVTAEFAVSGGIQTLGQVTSAASANGYWYIYDTNNTLSKFNSMYIFIYEGTGIGQILKIISSGGTYVQLNIAEILPDTTSKYAIIGGDKGYYNTEVSDLNFGTNTSVTFTGLTEGVKYQFSINNGAIETGNAEYYTSLLQTGLSIEDINTTSELSYYENLGIIGLSINRLNLVDNLVFRGLSIGIVSNYNFKLKITDSNNLSIQNALISLFEENWVYKGNWDVSTNTPELNTLIPIENDMYKIIVEGNNNITGEDEFFEVGDVVIFNGVNWCRYTKRYGVSDEAGYCNLNFRSNKSIVLTSIANGYQNFKQNLIFETSDKKQYFIKMYKVIPIVSTGKGYAVNLNPKDSESGIYH